MTGLALEVDHLTKSFRLHHEKANSIKQLLAGKGRNRFDEFTALKDVTFDVKEGEVFGVIGQNGSGKSTLLKCMAGILQPNGGSVRVHKRMSALLELGAGFHPELSGRDNVFLNAAILGMTRKDIAARFDDIVEFSGLAELHRLTRQDLLVGHVRAARLRRGHQRRPASADHRRDPRRR